jgi:hypothetical protein
MNLANPTLDPCRGEEGYKDRTQAANYQLWGTRPAQVREQGKMHACHEVGIGMTEDLSVLGKMHGCHDVSVGRTED